MELSSSPLIDHSSFFTVHLVSKKTFYILHYYYHGTWRCPQSISDKSFCSTCINSSPWK